MSNIATPDALRSSTTQTGAQPDAQTDSQSGASEKIPALADLDLTPDAIVRDPILTVPFTGKARRLVFDMTLSRPLDEVYPFFADAHNLERITPPILKFRVRTPAPIDMKPGALIDYKLSLRGFPMRWRTKITSWEPPFRFIDTQLKGPYRLWHHEHLFFPIDGPQGDAVRCVDIVHYAHFGGRLIDNLLVRRDVMGIFAYRQQAMREIFEDRA